MISQSTPQLETIDADQLRRQFLGHAQPGQTCAEDKLRSANNEAALRTQRRLIRRDGARDSLADNGQARMQANLKSGPRTLGPAAVTPRTSYCSAS